MRTSTSIFNDSLQDIADAIISHDGFCICGHVSPDGDCIGSELALYWVLKRMGKDVVPLLAKDDSLDAALSSLPGSAELIPAQATERFPVFIAVDVPLSGRMGNAAADLFEKADLRITIDHHEAEAKIADIQYTDPDSPSASCLIWELIKLLDVDAKGEPATCCYAGLMTDTGRFQYQNTDAFAFEMAKQMVDAGVDVGKLSSDFFQNKTLASIQIDALAIQNMQLFADRSIVISYVTLADMKRLDAKKSDTENAINVLRSIGSVRVACMLKEYDDSIRGSFRSKDGTDVAALAAQFGGGGHKAAAGFTLHCSIDEAIQLILDALPVNGA